MHKQVPDNLKAPSVLLLLYVLLHGSIATLVPSFEPAIHNDDWVYVYTIERLAEGESFRLHPMSAALALPQIVVGWGLCAVAGTFSYSLLRGAMVVFGFVPVIYSWRILRHFDVDGRTALAATVLFMVNPLLVSITWSYQTDVVYVACLLAAFSAVLASTQTTSTTWKHHLAAAVWLLAACLTRQSGIFVAAAFGLWFLLRKSWKPTLLYWLIIPVTMLTERYFVQQSDLHFLPYTKGLVKDAVVELSASKLIYCVYEACHIVGLLALFAAPLILCAGIPKKSKWLLAAALLPFAGMWLLDAGSGRTLFLGNYLYLGAQSGIGPATLAIPPGGSSAPSTLGPLTSALTGLAIVAAVLGCWSSWGDYLNDLAKPFQRIATRDGLLRWSLLIQLGSVIMVSALIGRPPMDRYLLCLIPFAFVMVLPQKSSTALVAATWVCSFGLAFFSLVGVVDYWRWNAVRWQAVAELERQGIEPWLIDGGYEYNGIHGMLAAPKETGLVFDVPGKPTDPNYWKTRDQYTLRFEPASDPSLTVAAYSYESPFGVFQKTIYVTRTPATPTDILGARKASTPATRTVQPSVGI